MRGGNCSWQAADIGSIGPFRTNTMPDLPPGGGSEGTSIGYIHLILAVSRETRGLVLDMVMPQYSCGALGENCDNRDSAASVSSPVVFRIMSREQYFDARFRKIVGIVFRNIVCNKCIDLVEFSDRIY
jgi:hypothetical protein